MMVEDPRVVVLGEDILDPYGGVFKVTRGLSTRFPARVLTTPISESAIVGVATGLALRGLRPIAEIMFGDFVTLVADQLINHASKFRWMYDDQVRVPLVVRTPMGGRRGYGATHSQSLEKHFLGVPGLTVVAPHVLGDPGGLLRQAVLNDDEPVLFVESKACYGRQLVDHIPGMRVDTYADDRSEFPTTLARHEDSGGHSDGLICCYGGSAPLCLEAVRNLKEREGLSIDLAVFTQLSPPPTSHIRHVLSETHASILAYVEEANPVAGWGAELISQVEQIRAVDRSISAITHCRIGAASTPIPSSRELELRSLPQVRDIVSQVLSCF
jgi:pyruvate/2-oxoglutarate/acetoin dehydrogenase E1 component